MLKPSTQLNSSAESNLGAVADIQEEFKLDQFFPYLARVFYSQITKAVSQIYEDQYGMKRYEWRAMVILAPQESLTSAEIMERSSMDKVSVSRAVSALRKRGWILEQTNKKDGRSRLLKLSSDGRNVFQQLLPQMVALEQKILDDLSSDEIALLISLMKRVENSATDTLISK